MKILPTGNLERAVLTVNLVGSKSQETTAGNQNQTSHKEDLFPSYVSNYFILICSYYKLTSQVCCQSVDTSYGLSSSHEQCRFFLFFFSGLQFTISELAIFLCLPKNGKICGKNCYGTIGER